VVIAVQLFIGLQHRCCLGQHKLLNQTAGDTRNAHIQNFFLDHRSDRPGHVVFDFVFRCQISNYLGFTPSAAVLYSRVWAQHRRVAELLHFNVNNFNAAPFEVAPVMIVAKFSCCVFIKCLFQHYLHHRKNLTACYLLGVFFVIEKICYRFRKLLGSGYI